jgi:hypothetical protein
MRLVSENSDQDFKRRDAERHLKWALRRSAANFLRIIRGAGKAYEVPKQAVELVEALSEYREAWGHFPDEQTYLDHLNIAPETRPRPGGPEGDFSHAQDHIVRGSLQFAASRLLGQSAQIAAGTTEMFEGIQGRERAIEAMHKAHAERSAPKKKVAYGPRRLTKGKLTK